MKVIVFVKATKESEAGEMPSEQLLTEMTQFNEQLIKAGIVVAGEGLKPSSQGARVRFSGKERTVIDGPFAETKELVAGYWLWQVKSLQEAIEWVKRCPNPMLSESEIEIRPIFTAEDFGEAFTPELREREEQMRKQVEANAVTPSRFENGWEMTIAGLNSTYTPETRSGIPAQWDRFVSHIGKVPGQVGKICYGVCWNPKPSCGFDYLCGVEVSDTSRLPAGFTTIKLTPQRYAVFTHNEHVSLIPQTLDAIWTKWLPISGFTADAAPSFERYTEEFDPAMGKGGTEIWLAIK